MACSNRLKVGPIKYFFLSVYRIIKKTSTNFYQTFWLELLKKIKNPVDTSLIALCSTFKKKSQSATPPRSTLKKYFECATPRRSTLKKNIRCATPLWRIRKKLKNTKGNASVLASGAYLPILFLFINLRRPIPAGWLFLNFKVSGES